MGTAVPSSRRSGLAAVTTSCADRARTLRGGRLSGEALFDAVIRVNEDCCVPPKSAAEVHQAIGDVGTKFDPDPLPGTADVERPMMSPTDDESLFPTDPGAILYDGLVGACTAFLLDGTDASPAAIHASLLAFCGALMPAWGYWHGRHTSSPFLALVGKSGIGRKGTAMYRVRDALGNSLGMDKVNRTRFDGIASGEALVKALLDRTQQTFGVPTGVLFEEEYATFLAASGREGSNLDSRMRSGFDGKQLAHRKVGETILVPEPYYLSGLVAITPAELQARVTKASFKNGSGNRWLWLAGDAALRSAAAGPGWLAAAATCGQRLCHPRPHGDEGGDRCLCMQPYAQRAVLVMASGSGAMWPEPPDACRPRVRVPTVASRRAVPSARSRDPW